MTSGSNGKESDVPDLGGFAHHEGVIMELASDRGMSTYLQLDFGQEELTYQISSDFPDIRGLIDWSPQERFKVSPIKGEHGYPKRLVRVLESVEAKNYHAIEWNCQSFSEVVWLYFFEGNTGWVPDIHKIIQEVAEKQRRLRKEKYRPQIGWPSILDWSYQSS